MKSLSEVMVKGSRLSAEEMMRTIQWGTRLYLEDDTVVRAGCFRYTMKKRGGRYMVSLHAKGNASKVVYVARMKETGDTRKIEVSISCWNPHDRFSFERGKQIACGRMLKGRVFHMVMNEDKTVGLGQPEGIETDEWLGEVALEYPEGSKVESNACFDLASVRDAVIVCAVLERIAGCRKNSIPDEDLFNASEDRALGEWMTLKNNMSRKGIVLSLFDEIDCAKDEKKWSTKELPDIKAVHVGELSIDGRDDGIIF